MGTEQDPPATLAMDGPRARLALRLICSLSAGGVGIILLADALNGFSRNFIAIALMFAALAGCAAMSGFRALSRLTAAVFPAVVLAFLVLVLATGSGIHDPTSPAFIVVILVATLFLGKRGAIAYTGLSMLASGIVIGLDILRLLDNPFHSNWGTLVAFWVVTALGGTLLWFLLGELERKTLREAAAASKVLALNEALERRVEEKDFLLRELQHRVKNNLQQLAALVSIDSGAPDEGAESFRRAAERRIQAMADLYDLGSAGDKASEVLIGAYLETVCRSALPQRRAGPLDLDLDPGARAPMDKALLAGLLVAELVSAAQPSAVRLSVREEANGAWIGIELSESSMDIAALIANSGHSLFGILEDELGAAVSIDLEGSRIAATFLLAREGNERG